MHLRHHHKVQTLLLTRSWRSSPLCMWPSGCFLLPTPPSDGSVRCRPSRSSLLPMMPSISPSNTYAASLEVPCRRQKLRTWNSPREAEPAAAMMPSFSTYAALAGGALQEEKHHPGTLVNLMTSRSSLLPNTCISPYNTYAALLAVSCRRIWSTNHTSVNSQDVLQGTAGLNAIQSRLVGA